MDTVVWEVGSIALYLDVFNVMATNDTNNFSDSEIILSSNFNEQNIHPGV